MKIFDTHIHAAPDIDPRSADGISILDDAAQSDYFGIVLKSPVSETATAALTLRAARPGGPQVFGGVVLNHGVGGINPHAVDFMFRISDTAGRRAGRIVWLPTRDSENHLTRIPRGNLSPVKLWTDQGKPHPALFDVFALIKQYDGVLGTGHLAPDEIFRVVDLAREAGVERIVITHANVSPSILSISEQVALADRGCFIEQVYAGIFLGPGATEERLRQREGVPFATIVEGIRSVGCERTIVSTDLGAASLPDPISGMLSYVSDLESAGFSGAELESMALTNPRLLFAV